jgi:hypothetical protein
MSRDPDEQRDDRTENKQPAAPVVNINQQNSQVAGGSWISSLFSAGSMAVSSLPAVMDTVFGESKTDADRLKEASREISHVSRRSEHDLNRQRTVVENCRREMESLEKKRITDYRLEAAVTRFVQERQTLARMSNSTNKLGSMNRYLGDVVIDMRMVEAAGMSVDALERSQSIMDKQSGPLEVSARMQQAMMRSEMQQESLLQGMESGITASNDMIAQAIAESKQRIAQNTLTSHIEDASTVSASTQGRRVNQPISTSAVLAEEDDEYQAERLRKLKNG